MLLPIKLLIKVLAAIVGVIVIYFAITGVQVWLTSREHSTASADAAIVLGAAEYNGRPSPDLQARLDQALALFRARRVPLVAVTGGKIAGDVFTEAGVSARYLRAHGIPAADIVVGWGSDTYQNVSSVAPPLKARSVSSMLVVTDPFHEDRAMAIVSTFGFSPQPVPTATSPITGAATVPYFLKETVAVGIGRLIGYGTLSSASHPGS